MTNGVRWFQTFKINFRMDPALFKHCHSDAKKLCHASDDWVKVESTDVNNSPMILPCLYRHMKHHDKDPELQVRATDMI